jgi:hypothetical protein
LQRKYVYPVKHIILYYRSPLFRCAIYNPPRGNFMYSSKQMKHYTKFSQNINNWPSEDTTALSPTAFLTPIYRFIARNVCLARLQTTTKVKVIFLSKRHYVTVHSKYFGPLWSVTTKYFNYLISRIIS